MKLKRTIWFSLHSSLWFVPSVLVALGAAGAVAMLAIDARWGERIVEAWPQALSAEPDGARQVLAAIATSMITVAGVTFSVTVVTLSLASSQYGSRVLRNFMRDPINQGVLGILVSVFTYCIIVLQAVRSDGQPFVPQLALWGGVLLSLVGIGGLVAFIHHTAVSIQAGEIIAKIAEETIGALEAARTNAAEEVTERGEIPSDTADWQVVAAQQSGYVQDINVHALVRRADERTVVIAVHRSVGDFSIAGRPLLAVTPRDRLSPQDIDFLRQQFGISTYRTIEQDPEFGVRQLVDIALKALSPSLNDSTTAVNCIDYLERILQAAVALPAAPEHQGKKGRLCLMLKQPGPVRLLRVALNEIRQNAQVNVAVTLRLLKLIADLRDRCSDAAIRAELNHQAQRIRDGAECSALTPADRDQILERADRLLATDPN